MRYILGLSWLLVSVCLMGQNAKLYLKTAEQLMSNGSYQEAVEEYSRVLLRITSYNVCYTKLLRIHLFKYIRKMMIWFRIRYYYVIGVVSSYNFV